MFEGYKLAVLFDEKDDVKSKGARWDPDDQIWWIPVHKATPITMEYFNDNKMVMGQYGKFDQNYLDEDGKLQGNMHRIVKHPLAKKITGIDPWTWVWVEQYENVDVVKITHQPTLPQETIQWATMDDARKIWGELVEEGYTAFLDNSPENDENNS